jgi:hypothetical protein
MIIIIIIFIIIIIIIIILGAVNLNLHDGVSEFENNSFVSCSSSFGGILLIFFFLTLLY